MRVAVCLSGQTRTYKSCAAPILNFFRNANPDYFIRALNSNNWADSNSSKYGVDYWNEEKLNPVDLKNELSQLFNPISIDVVDKTPVRAVVAEAQFYESMMANHMKSCHEMMNNFSYDLVVKCRFDVAWDESVKFDPYSLSDGNALYVSKVVRDNRVGVSHIHPMALDRVYSGSSRVMNIIADIYKFIDFYHSNNDTHPIYNIPETALYSFAKNHNIQIIEQTPIETIVRRDAIDANCFSDIKRIEHSFFNL